MHFLSIMDIVAIRDYPDSANLVLVIIEHNGSIVIVLVIGMWNDPWGLGCVVLCFSDESTKVQAVVVDLKGLPRDSVLELATSIRNLKSNLKSLPILALSMNLTAYEEKRLKDVGVSHFISKPLRYSTLAAVLLETVGIPTRAPMKKPNANAMMLSGRKLLVVRAKNIPISLN